jgi:hypothetical protein
MGFVGAGLAQRDRRRHAVGGGVTGSGRQVRKPRAANVPRGAKGEKRPGLHLVLLGCSARLTQPDGAGGPGGPRPYATLYHKYTVITV